MSSDGRGPVRCREVLLRLRNVRSRVVLCCWVGVQYGADTSSCGAAQSRSVLSRVGKE